MIEIPSGTILYAFAPEKSATLPVEAARLGAEADERIFGELFFSIERLARRVRPHSSAPDELGGGSTRTRREFVVEGYWIHCLEALRSIRAIDAGAESPGVAIRRAFTERQAVCYGPGDLSERILVVEPAATSSCHVAVVPPLLLHWKQSPFSEPLNKLFTEHYAGVD